MCGITGFNWEDKQLLRRMSKCIEHRGPDQEGSLSDKHASIANRRLSIIDLSKKGRQPISNEDGTVHIVYNGELYNYLDIKPKLAGHGHRFRSDTDTEVILHAYEKYGFNCLRMFNGDFAFCIYDTKKKILFLARDPIGVKPLYYYNKDGKFIFSSELKSILLEPSVKRKVNSTSLSYLLTFRFIPWQDSIVQDVKKVIPGTYLVYHLNQKKLSIHSYWDVNVRQENKSEDYFAAKIREIFLDSVERRLMSDVPLGVYLSGGVDSGSLVSAVCKLKKEATPVKTFSVGFGYGKLTDELAYSKNLAEHFSTDHHEFIITPDIVRELPKIVYYGDEPISDTAHIPFYYLAKNARRHVTVVLSGEGGDELFAGYEHYKFVPLLKSLGKLGMVASYPAAAALKVAPPFILNKFFKYASALGDEGKKRLVKALRASTSEEKYLEVISIFDAEERKQVLSEGTATVDVSQQLKPYFSKGNLLNNMLRLELKTVLPESYLMKGDKMNMASSVEARVPILDRRLVELAFSMPASLKLRGRQEKYIFKKAMQPLVPELVVKRKKQRFYVPIDLWIKELMPVYERLLSRKNIESQGYFNPYRVNKIMERYKSSPLFYSRQLWTLLVFQMWHSMYIEGIPFSKVKL